MKCVHCSQPLSPTDWFCPNCKRSAQPSRRARRAGIVRLAALGGLAALVVGAAGVSRLRPRPRVRVVDNTPLVTFRELPERQTSPAPSPEEARDGKPEERAKPVVRAVPQPEAAPVTAPVANDGEPGTVSVTTDPPVATFVYLNGGSLLGKTPIEHAVVPAGRQTLVFWTPSLGGRSRRTVQVVSGETTHVIEPVHAQDQFTETAGG